MRVGRRTVTVSRSIIVLLHFCALPIKLKRGSWSEKTKKTHTKKRGLFSDHLFGKPAKFKRSIHPRTLFMILGDKGRGRVPVAVNCKHINKINGRKTWLFTLKLVYTPS